MGLFERVGLWAQRCYIHPAHNLSSVRRYGPTMKVEPNQLWRHFKGNLYKIVCVAQHTETSNYLVVYHNVDNPRKIYARPLRMFLNKVEGVQRFKFEGWQ
jgi:hypothetical protein